MDGISGLTTGDMLAGRGRLSGTRIDSTGLAKYRNLHRWMIIPMVLMQLGILRDYWGDFTDNTWAVHVHYWTGTAWYVYLIIQPYYATHGKLEKHRTNGIIGMFLAGGVMLTAFSMLYADIHRAHRSMESPELFGPFEPWFFYGIAAVETVMILAFGFAVIQAILKRKSLDDHAWWLISTVFIIMMPALSRGIAGIQIAINIEDWPDIHILSALYISQGIIIALIALAAWKLNKLRHPATWLAIAVNLFVMFLGVLGKSPAVQQFLESVIKG